MMTAIGNFFFKWRDKIFPLLMLLFLVLLLSRGVVFGTDENLLDLLGLLAMRAGEALRVSVVGLLYITRGGRNKRVYADLLVTEGMFSICRNPLYLGNILIACGALLIHAHPILMSSGIAATVLIYIAIVSAEEHFLREKFGAAYGHYCDEVNRWAPSLTQLPTALSGMVFNWRRVLTKEYTTLAGVLAGITLLLALEAGGVGGEISPVTGATLLAIAVVFIIVRGLKKSSHLVADE